MTREQLADHKKRMIRVQQGLLKAVREPHEPALGYVVDAVEQIACTLNALLKELQE